LTPDLPKRVWNNVQKHAFEQAARLWRDEHLPKHFTTRGAKLYGYEPRSGEGKSGKAFWRSYSGRKKKYLGHMRPLVFSGESRRRALGSRTKATSKYGAVPINAPALSYKNPHSDIDMRSEVTRITEAEVRQHETHFMSKMLARLAAVQESRNKTIR
jgi:hypothetical protein